jgi:aldose 1-epimerase
MLTEQDTLIVNYFAMSATPTIVNMTQHSYFNLNDDQVTILDHALTINANAFLPIDQDRLPTGEIKPVARTPFDFTVPKLVNDAFDFSNEQIKLAQGLDHCFALAKADEEIGHAATLFAPVGRRMMEVHTSLPGIQIFTGNSIEGIGRNNIPIRPYSGMAMETCHFPDAPHHANFPSIVLTPDKKYMATTIYKFDILEH